MAHIHGRDKLMAWFDANNSEEETAKPYWALFSSKADAANGGGKCFLSAPDTPSLSSKTTKDLFEKALETVADGSRLYVRLRRTFSDPKHESVTEYTHTDPSNRAYLGQAHSANIAEEVQKALDAYKKELAHAEEIKALKEQIKELKEDDGMNRISGILNHPAVQTFVASLVPQLMGKPSTTTTPTPTDMKVAINGLPDNGELTPEEQEQEERIGNSVNELLEADPEADKVLEKLAALAKNKPELYNQYRPMLLAI